MEAGDRLVALVFLRSTSFASLRGARSLQLPRRALAIQRRGIASSAVGGNSARTQLGFHHHFRARCKGSTGNGRKDGNCIISFARTNLAVDWKLTAVQNAGAQQTANPGVGSWVAVPSWLPKHRRPPLPHAQAPPAFSPVPHTSHPVLRVPISASQNPNEITSQATFR